MWCWNTAHLFTHTYLRAFLSGVQMCLRLFVAAFLVWYNWNRLRWLSSLKEGWEFVWKTITASTKICSSQFKLCHTSRTGARDPLSLSHWLNYTDKWKWITGHCEPLLLQCCILITVWKRSPIYAEYYIPGYSLVSSVHVQILMDLSSRFPEACAQ